MILNVGRRMDALHDNMTHDMILYSTGPDWFSC